jgi:bacteriocin-like protein
MPKMRARKEIAMKDQMKELNDRELNNIVGGHAGDTGGTDDDGGGVILIRPDGPFADVETTSGTGKFKIKRTHTSGG